MVVACAICLDSSINDAVTPCEESHDHTLCRDCAVSYICNKIDSAFLGSCPAILCPYPHKNKKSRTFRYDAWVPIVPPEATTKYDSLANSVLAIMCSECHTMGTLQVSPSSTQIDEASEFFVKTSSLLGEALLANLATYDAGMLSTEEIYDDLSMQFFGDQLSSSYKKDTWNIVFHALALVSNPERRLTLHLRHLRDNPLFWTPCCNAVHCFRCRTSGEHESESCEDNMSKLDNDIVTCPSCAVSIVKGDGCDSVACVCGAYLSWSTEKTKRKYREDFLAAFPTNTTAACARLLLDTMSDDQGASDMLSHARMWQAHNVVAVNKEFLQAWAARFSGYTAQACLVLTSGAGAGPFTLSAGYHEAGRLWRSQRSAEVDKCIAANKVAVRDLFPSQFPEGPERVLAAVAILDSKRVPSFLLGGYECYRCDERMVSSATEWRSRHQREYEEGVDALESRLALQFLYLHGQATPSQTTDVAAHRHTPFALTSQHGMVLQSLKGCLTKILGGEKKDVTFISELSRQKQQEQQEQQQAVADCPVAQKGISHAAISRFLRILPRLQSVLDIGDFKLATQVEIMKYKQWSESFAKSSRFASAFKRPSNIGIGLPLPHSATSVSAFASTSASASASTSISASTSTSISTSTSTARKLPNSSPVNVTAVVQDDEPTWNDLLWAVCWHRRFLMEEQKAAYKNLEAGDKPPTCRVISS